MQIGDDTITVFEAYQTRDIAMLKNVFVYEDICSQKQAVSILTVNDVMIRKMINKAYRVYTSPYIYKAGDVAHYKKDTISCFLGDKQDMADVFYNEIVKIFKEGKEISDEKTFYKYIKYKIIATVNDSLKAQETSKEMIPIIECQNSDETIDLRDKVAYRQFQVHNDYNYILGNSPTHGYTSIMQEALNLIRNNDLKDMLRSDAKLAKHLIDIIMSNDDVIVYSELIGGTKLVTQSKLADMVYKAYGYKPHENKICEALDLLYEIIIKCIYGSVTMSRAEYCKVTEQLEQEETDQTEKKQKDEFDLQNEIIEQEENEYYKKIMKARDKHESELQDDTFYDYTEFY